MSMIIDGTNGATFNDGSLQAAAASPYVLKNRIINGDMVIDQRNAGASVTPSNSYTLDRWTANTSVASKFTIQQSTTAPTGFKNSLLVTSSSAYSVGSSDILAIQQKIEGYNVADLGWGASGASTVTLSFWVRSSLTGTFGGSISNAGYTRSYPFNYTISAANTWEQKTVTITGDTTGTWATDNSTGIRVIFGLGVGSTYSGTAGAWASSELYSVTGATSVVGTNGATWYITAVQLEIGTSATPFEQRLYNQELANCQRYYAQLAAYSGSLYVGFGAGTVRSSTTVDQTVFYPSTLRAQPTITLTSVVCDVVTYSTKPTSASALYYGTNSVLITFNNGVGLSGGQASNLIGNGSSNAKITFSAEL